MLQLDALTQIAAAVKDRPGDIDLIGAFRAALSNVTDQRLLHGLVRTFEAELEVGVPVLERRLELEPANIDAMTQLATLYAMHLKAEPARRWATEALRHNPANSDALYALLMSTSPDAIAERERICRAILSITPRTTVELAEILRSTGRADEAQTRLDAEEKRLQREKPESDQLRAVRAERRKLLDR